MATTTQTQNSPVRSAYIVLIIAVFSFGFTGIFAKLADAPGMVVAAWRVSVAALALFIPYIRQNARDRRIDKYVMSWALVTGVIFAITMAVFHVSLKITSAANATFLGNIAPMWVGLITRYALHKPLPQLFWPGTVVALIGAALIVFGDGGIGAINNGDIIVLANSVLWALYTIIAGIVRTRVSTVTWVWLIVTISAFILVPVCIIMDLPLIGYTMSTTLVMIASGVISQSAGFIGYNYALGHIPAPRVAVMNMMQPVITAVLAVFILAEPFQDWRLVGGFTLLFGVYLVNRPESQSGKGSAST